MNALLKKLKARYSLKPPLVLQTDNGPEFKIQFERALDKEVKVTHGPTHTSNAQGEVAPRRCQVGAEYGVPHGA